ncbi:MAG: tetratricopeptide repeat protein [Terriglobia bacterium]|jgi:serine/threonine protein kinase/tetratricopeptide (TPR) repeat protein
MTATSGVAEGWSVRTPAEGGTTLSGSSQALQPGHVLGGRYEILELLGQGGMGAVYKARDREVDRLVALKVIRPELAGHPDVLRRFKQELILARQVTHKNVIRIFDLGEAEGAKFISMEYIDGRDLKSIRDERGKFQPEEAAEIIEQVCRALDAAHAEGVIHRDLKPQNIMVDKHGRVAVMDFGIARSRELPGLTQTGDLVGTPEYMSPEQAKGEEIDSRSDLFSLGVILYELLTGRSPYQAKTSVAALLKRTQERAVPPDKLDPAIPKFVNDIVVRCLEIDPQRRYASAQEIVQDLEARHRPRRGVATLHMLRFRMVEELPTKWIAPGLALLLLLTVGLVFRGKIFGPAVKPKPSGPAISLAVLPFRNASGDPSLDWLGSSLAEWLSTDVGQSSYLRTVSSDRLHQILHDLRIAADSNLDPDTLRRVAEFSSAQTVVWGQYAKLGEQIRIDATLRDLKQDRTTTLKAEAPNQGALPEAVDRLAQAIRENLALSSSEMKELQAQAFKPTSKSLPALRDYNEGLQLLRQGKNLEAQKRFEAATKEDPEFALAYAKLGQTYANLGYDNEAERASRKAVDLSDKLPPQEKNRILAGYAQVRMDYAKAIEAYENMAKVSPDDTQVQFILAGLYEDTSAFDKAREHYAQVLKADPKHVEALLGMGRVEIKSGNPQGGLEYLNRTLTLAIQLENEEEKATVLQAIGIAYRLLNRQDEALRNYQESLAIKRRLGDKRGMAASLNMIAQIQERLGKPDQALKSYEEALQLRREIGDRKGTADILSDLGGFYQDRGQHDQALKLLKESLLLQRELGNERNQALCLNQIGSSYFFKGQYEDAVTYFQQALQLREKSKFPNEIAETVHNLAETLTNMGQYNQALGYYLRALELYRSAGDKRGAAIESASMGTLFAYQGRYGAAVNAKQEALNTFRELGDRSFWMIEILSGYGDALAQAGRGEESQKSFDEAMSLARELKNDAFVAQILDYQGDSLFYRGNFRSARSLYEQAMKVASHSADRGKALISEFDLAKAAVKERRSQAAISTLKGLAQEADTLGLQYLSAECSIYLAEALVNTRDYSRARQELERAVAKTERLGLRTLSAKGHYLLATILRLTGKGAEAAGHYREALRLLEDIRNEAGVNNVLQRADLNSIYTECKRWLQGGRS